MSDSLWLHGLSHVQLFETPCTVAHQTPLSMGFSRQEFWSELSFPSPGDLPDPGLEPWSPALQADSLLHEPWGKPLFPHGCLKHLLSHQFSSVQLLSHIWLSTAPWTETCQPSLSITNSWSLLKLMSIHLAIHSNHLISCHPLLLLTSIFSSVRVFSNESVLMRWSKC